METTRPAITASPRIPLKAALLLILINLIWAGSSLQGKNALNALGPFTIAFLRFGPSALLLFIVAKSRGDRFKIQRSDWPFVLFTGSCGIALTYGIYYHGLASTTATESTLLIASEPIIVALAARIMLGERLRTIQQAGLIIGFTGVYLIIAQGLAFRITTGVLANATVLGALTFECCAAVVAKRLTDTYRWVVVLTLEFGIGALLLMPGAVWEMSRLAPSSVHWTVWANLAYMSLLCSFFCYAVWYWLLPKHPVSSMAGFLFIQPMMGPVLAWAFRHEKMGYWTLIGALLVVVGVSLVTVLKPRNRTLDAATSMPPQHGG